MFATLGHAILGLVLLVGITGAAMVVIVTATKHDIHSCSCSGCYDRRERRFAKLMERRKATGEYGPSNPRSLGWKSTNQLRVAMRVMSRSGTVYQVHRVIDRSPGKVVLLINTQTGMPSQVSVAFHSLNNPMWKLAERNNWR